MKKVLFLIAGLMITSLAFSQLVEQSDSLTVGAVTDSVSTFQGYARGNVFITVDFRNADAYDGTLGIGGSQTAFDTTYAEYASVNNPVTLNLTNYPDTICRIERTVGLSAPWLKVKLTSGSVTAFLKYPITISFDRF